MFLCCATQFVAHPNVQQLLAAIWYDGLPGFRRKSMIGQMVEVGKLGAMFAMYGSMYMMNPDSKMGQLMKKPFIKFVCHSSSYAFFLSKFNARRRWLYARRRHSLLSLLITNRLVFLRAFRVAYSVTRAGVSESRISGTGMDRHRMDEIDTGRNDQKRERIDTRANRSRNHIVHYK